MDPITTAIVAILPAMASDILKSSVKDAYEGLKAILRKKWGGDNSIASTVDALEKNPSSEAQAAALTAKVAETNVLSDPEVAQALTRLIGELKQKGIGGDRVAAVAVTISNGGSQQGIIAENVRVDSLNFGARPES